MSAMTRAYSRWGMDGAPPTRDPDFALEGWMDQGEVRWIRFERLTPEEGGPADFDRAMRVDALFDSAFVYADQRDEQAAGEPVDRPAIWYRLHNSGAAQFRWAHDLATRTNWRHGLWLVRQWWRLTLRWSVLVWRVTRGKG